LDKLPTIPALGMIGTQLQSQIYLLLTDGQTERRTERHVDINYVRLSVSLSPTLTNLYIESHEVSAKEANRCIHSNCPL